jgi:hypothetical protein
MPSVLHEHTWHSGSVSQNVSFSKMVGAAVGVQVGISVGSAESCLVGWAVGGVVGVDVGGVVGTAEGVKVGVGRVDGVDVGVTLTGAAVGEAVGVDTVVGTDEGVKVGAALGSLLVFPVFPIPMATNGTCVGLAIGGDVVRCVGVVGVDVNDDGWPVVGPQTQSLFGPVTALHGML